MKGGVKCLHCGPCVTAEVLDIERVIAEVWRKVDRIGIEGMRGELCWRMLEIVSVQRTINLI